jgi:hypothetical protein
MLHSHSYKIYLDRDGYCFIPSSVLWFCFWICQCGILKKKKNYDFSICKTVGLDPEGSPADVICKNNLLDIYDALFIALTDYTSDSKGDVGAWYVFISYMINVVFK